MIIYMTLNSSLQINFVEKTRQIIHCDATRQIKIINLIFFSSLPSIDLGRERDKEEVVEKNLPESG
jgi:hypothetical protein